MMPREAWEEEESERLLGVIRQRRQALEEFAAHVPAFSANAPSEEARAKIQPLASHLDDLLRHFHMNGLDEMEQLRREIEELCRRP
jgi:hypothetical protein